MIRHNGIEIDRRRLVISHAGRSRFFTNSHRAGAPPVMFKMWEAMILGPIDRERMFEHIYGHYENGGPIAGPWVLHIRLHQWKTEYPKIFLKLDKKKWSGVVHYQLVPDVV